MICNECRNDISVVSHKSWCSDYKYRDPSMIVTSADVMELASTSDASGYVQRIAWLEHENAAL